MRSMLSAATTALLGIALGVGTSATFSGPAGAYIGPSLVGTPNVTSVTLGSAPVTLTDSANLLNAVGPTGSLTFTLFNGATIVDTEMAAVNGNGTYSTPIGYTLPSTGTVVGTYQWDVAYSGDGNNSPLSYESAANEQVTVSAASSTISGIPNTTSVTLNGSAVTLSDSASLSGGFYPSGTLTFTLIYGVTQVDTEEATVSGNGNYATPIGYTLPATGTVVGSYQWNVTYSGDNNNNASALTYASNEEVTVTAGATYLASSASPAAVTLGTTSVTLTDSAALYCQGSATGTLTFTLLDGATTVDTEWVTVAGCGTYSTPIGYTLPGPEIDTGTYQWDSTYSGDTDNQPSSSVAQVTVGAAAPTVAGTPSPSSVTLNGASVTLTDSAVLSGGFYPGGTLSFTLFDGATLVDTETTTVVGNGTYSTPIGYTLPAVSGTYQWNVSYSGDGNNAPVSEVGAPSEQVTVLGPSKLAFTTAPPAAQAGSPFTVAVSVEYAGGAVDPSATSSVTLALRSHPAGAVLSCTDIPVTTSAGVATFTCSVNRPGSYSLEATAPSLMSAISPMFLVTPGPPSQLAFHVEPPATAPPRAGFIVTVLTEDAFGNAIRTDDNTVVTLSLGRNPSLATFRCASRSVTDLNGVAKFICQVNKAGNGYTLKATAKGLLPATSTRFNVS